jgi:hypothetical protein
MPNIVIHYSSYSRGWRPLCGAPHVPEAVRGTFAVKDVTCPKCLDAMSEETLRSEVGHGDAGSRLR